MSFRLTTYIFTLLISLNSLAGGLLSPEDRQFIRDLRNNTTRSFTEYDFKGCIPKESENTYFVNCVEGDLVSSITNPEVENKFNSTQSITTPLLNDYLLTQIQKEMLVKLDENKAVLESLVNCEKAPSEACKTNIEKHQEIVRTTLPMMRKSLSYLDQGLRSTRAPQDDLFASGLLAQKIEHPYTGVEIPPLTMEEMSEISKDREEIISEYRRGKLEDENPCFVENRGIARYRNGVCQGNFRLSEIDHLRTTVSSRRKAHQMEYNSLISKAPFLLYIDKTSSELSGDLTASLQNAYKQMLEDVSAKRKEIASLKGRDRNSLISYKDIVERVIQKNPGSSGVLCDIAQTQFNNLENREMLITGAIAGGALLGGALCAFTVGLTCPITVAVASEGAFLYNSQQEYERAMSDFNSGLVDAEKLESAIDGRTEALLFAPLSFTGLSAARQVVRPAGEFSSVIRRGELSNSLRSRDSFVETYEKLIPTTPAQNRRWIEIANGSRNAKFYDIENGAIKRLNDTLDDKQFVTAATNLHKDHLLTEFKQLEQQFPGLKFEVYSDFKSTRFAVFGRLPSDLDHRIAMAFNRATDKTVADIKRLPKSSDLERRLGKENIAGWFTCGSGGNADQAGVLTRFARDKRPPQGCFIDNQTTRAYLADRLSDVDELQLRVQKIISSRPGGSRLLENVSGTNRMVPNLDLAEILRKADTPEAIQSVLRSKFGVDINISEAGALKDYYIAADKFSPGLRIDERIVASVDDAVHGSIIADRAGMGALNAGGVFRALAGNSDDPLKAIVKARDEEIQITQAFMREREEFNSIIDGVFGRHGSIQETLCSGDDCVTKVRRSVGGQVADSVRNIASHIRTGEAHVYQGLSPEIKRDIVESFTEIDQPSKYRMVFVPRSSSAMDRAKLSEHGETLEKNLRKYLTGVQGNQMTNTELKDYLFAFDMPETLNSGGIRIMIGKRGTEMSEAQRQKIKEHLEDALNSLNQDKGSNYSIIE